MDNNNSTQSRTLPEKIDVYVIGENGSVTDGGGCMPEVFIEEQYAGRLYDVDTALHIRRNFGHIVGVMRDTTFRAIPGEYKTRKMILGKAQLP